MCEILPEILYSDQAQKVKALYPSSVDPANTKYAQILLGTFQGAGEPERAPDSQQYLSGEIVNYFEAVEPHFQVAAHYCICSCKLIFVHAQSLKFLLSETGND